MSAQLQTSNSFSAHLALAAGVAVSINAPTLEALAITVAKVQGTAANDAKPAATPAAPKADAGNVKPASTPAPASAQAAASGSEQPAGDGPQPTYDDVRARVLSLAKISRDTAAKALAGFKTVSGGVVDHGNKLKLEDYPAFIAAADKVLAAGVAA